MTEEELKYIEKELDWDECRGMGSKHCDEICDVGAALISEVRECWKALCTMRAALNLSCSSSELNPHVARLQELHSENTRLRERIKELEEKCRMKKS